MFEAFLVCCSLHMGWNGQENPGKLNQLNPGAVFVEDRFVEGVFRNSLGKDTAFAGLKLGDKYGLVGGVATGYKIPVFGAGFVKVGRVMITVTPAQNYIVFGFGVKIW